jgi:transposase
MKTKRTARERAQVIMRVRAGLMTAQAAAAALGVSRKTYYAWEEKGLQGMLGRLENRPAGRPKTAPPAAVQALTAKVQTLEKQLAAARQTAELRGLLRRMEQPGFKKKRSKSKGSSP